MKEVRNISVWVKYSLTKSLLIKMSKNLIGLCPCHTGTIKSLFKMVFERNNKRVKSLIMRKEINRKQRILSL